VAVSLSEFYGLLFLVGPKVVGKEKEQPPVDLGYRSWIVRSPWCGKIVRRALERRRAVR
jgi:hypothetical protein